MAAADDQSRADQSLADPQSAAATGPDDPAAEFYGLDYSDDDGDGDGEDGDGRGDDGGAGEGYARESDGR